MIFFVLFISITYYILIILLIIGFEKVSVFVTDISKNSELQKFTILIPFRNEAKNIANIANSLSKLNYPISHFEIIWINDQSTDNSVPLLTEFIIKNHHWKMIDNQRKSNSPKKDAISTAIRQANNEWVVTTDADCIVPMNWLHSFNQYLISQKKQIKMIAAPVAYQVNNTFLQQFQHIDFLSLIGTTIGAFGMHNPFMCNGANLCYSKQTFFEVNGFDGNDTISSGDDVFLLEKFHEKYPKEIFYLKSKDAIVYTKPVETIKKLVNQRIRWASKTSSTKNIFSKIVGILVLLMNVITIFLLIYGLINLLFGFVIVGLKFLIMVLMKSTIDYLLINKTAVFTNQQVKLKDYLLSALLYPFFVTYVFIRSLTKKSVWKGR